MNPVLGTPSIIPVPKTRVSLAGNWLAVHFPEKYDTLSWAVLGGDRSASAVFWRKVKPNELLPGVNPELFLSEKISAEFGDKSAVGLLTSANLEDYSDVQKSHGEFQVRCIATVGLSNAVRIGDPSVEEHKIGTINLLCVVSHPLSFEARVEAVSLAAEARTAAVLDAGILSPVTNLPSTGTGTDCIVIASPQGPGAKYAGKHTVLGSLIGSSAYEAMVLGIKRWASRLQ